MTDYKVPYLKWLHYLNQDDVDWYCKYINEWTTPCMFLIALVALDKFLGTELRNLWRHLCSML